MRMRMRRRIRGVALRCGWMDGWIRRGARGRGRGGGI